MDRENDYDPNMKEILLSDVERKKIEDFFKSLEGRHTFQQCFGGMSTEVLREVLIVPLTDLVSDIENFIQLREPQTGGGKKR